MPEERMTVQIDNAQLIFKNFVGKAGVFNKEGSKNFAVILDDENAIKMLEDGWNVKHLEAREEGDTPTPYISVAVRFDNFPPRVVMITSKGRVSLTADTIECLDTMDLKVVDIIINASNWSMPDGKSGVKAYLKTMFVTVNEDPLELRYGIAGPPDLEE